MNTSTKPPQRANIDINLELEAKKFQTDPIYFHNDIKCPCSILIMHAYFLVKIQLFLFRRGQT